MTIASPKMTPDVIACGRLDAVTARRTMTGA